MSGPVRAQVQAPMGPSLYRSPVKEIKLEKIILEGNRTVDRSLIINTLQVREGEEYLPPVLRQRVQASVNALHKLSLFSDIKVDMESPDTSEGIHLIVSLTELPTLAHADFEGNKKIKKDDIKDAMDLLDGQVYSRSAVERNRQKILDLYHDKGYLLAEVKVKEGTEEATGRKTVTFEIKEGKKVRVRYIAFQGNREVPDNKLRKRLGTKEDRWWRDGEFKEDEFRLGLDSLVDYYRELGYLDATVKGEKVEYTPDKKHMDIRVDVAEGRLYRFGKATFVHNNIVADPALYAQLLLDSGEIFNMKKYQATKFQVQSVFREEGYLFMEMEDRFAYRDSIVDVTFNIREKSIAHIHLVDIRGNTKTKDKVIRREIKLFPGDIFRQSLVMRSQRDIMQLAFFDNVEPDIEVVQEEGERGDVNLVLKVTEKQAGTGTVSAGLAYSARDALVGTIGLQIPNFLGNGQRADLNLEYGQQKRLASVGFTEPWFLDTPTLVGGSLFYSYQEGFNNAYDYERYGLRLNLGRRLTWPDDYFSVSSSYNFSFNDNGITTVPSALVVPSGLESSLHLTLTRDDKNLPFFPSEGSRYRLTYSRVGGFLGGDFNYDQVEGKVNYWFPTFGKLVLGLETEYGMLLGDRIQSFDLFQMGGVLGYQGKLRGYDPGSIGGGRIGRSFFSFVTELTYPVVENTFYLMGFFDAGNVFGTTPKFDQELGTNSYNPVSASAIPDPWEEVDFSDLRKDIGFGFRLVIPLVAPFGMGFDFGWALDDQESFTDGRRYKKAGRAPQLNFVIEQGF